MGKGNAELVHKVHRNGVVFQDKTFVIFWRKLDQELD